MNKLAYDAGVRQALVDAGLVKQAGSRAAEIALGLLPGGPFLAGVPSGVSDDPRARYWPAVGRSLLTNLGGGLGGGVGAAAGALLSGGHPVGAGIGALLGLGGGFWGGRALGESVTDYDPERGY